MPEPDLLPDAPVPDPGPPAVAVAGRARPLAVLGLAEVGELRAWAKARQPDPLAAVRPFLDGQDPAVQRALVDGALAELRRPVAFGSPEFVGALQTAGGLQEVLWLSLRRAGAAVTRAESDAAAAGMDMNAAAGVFAVAMGQT